MENLYYYAQGGTANFSWTCNGATGSQAVNIAVQRLGNEDGGGGQLQVISAANSAAAGASAFNWTIPKANQYQIILYISLLVTVTTLIRFIAFESSFFLKFVFACSQFTLFSIIKSLDSQVKSGADITEGFINLALTKYLYLTYAIYLLSWVSDAAWKGYWIVSSISFNLKAHISLFDDHADNDTYSHILIDSYTDCIQNLFVLQVETREASREEIQGLRIRMRETIKPHVFRGHTQCSTSKHDPIDL
jgi:hypothetical protein